MGSQRGNSSVSSAQKSRAGRAFSKRPDKAPVRSEKPSSAGRPASASGGGSQQQGKRVSATEPEHEEVEESSKK